MVQASLFFFFFFKIRSSGLPQYLNELIPKMSKRFSPLPNFKITTKLFRNLFFPYTDNEWNYLGNIIKSSEWYLTFTKRPSNLIRPKCNATLRSLPPNWIEFNNPSTRKLKSSEQL